MSKFFRVRRFPECAGVIPKSFHAEWQRATLDLEKVESMAQQKGTFRPAGKMRKEICPQRTEVEGTNQPIDSETCYLKPDTELIPAS